MIVLLYYNFKVLIDFRHNVIDLSVRVFIILFVILTSMFLCNMEHIGNCQKKITQKQNCISIENTRMVLFIIVSYKVVQQHWNLLCDKALRYFTQRVKN